MGYKGKFTTPAENAMEHFSGWTGVNCETYKRGKTKAQLLYSMRVYGKPLTILLDQSLIILSLPSRTHENFFGDH